jgi:long-chain acyl-CoA synthetase
MGESVKAIVQPSPGIEPCNAVGKALIAHCRAHLAGYKIPRSVDFVAELPRLATGKLFKQDLRALLAG